MVTLSFVLIICISSIGAKIPLEKKSANGRNGDPMTWLLLNQIQSIDNRVGKLQDAEKELTKRVSNHEKEINTRVLKLEHRVSNLNDGQETEEKIDALQSDMKKLQKKTRQQDKLFTEIEKRLEAFIKKRGM